MKAVSPLTVQRLAVYLRALRELRDKGLPRISSAHLAKRYGLSATQIRKDLAEFGAFGIRGVGYDVAQVVERLTAILGLGRTHAIAIVGMGSLGGALARSSAFNGGAFRVVAGFDSDPQKIGRRIGSVLVRPLRELRRLVREREVRIGVLTVPSQAALEAADQLAEAGVGVILNFTRVRLPARDGVRVQTVDLRLELEEAAYNLAGAAVSPPSGRR